METAEVIFSVFEGSCPYHDGEPVVARSVCGTADFLEEYAGYVTDAEDAYEFDTPRDVRGEIEFICPDGCRITVAQTLGGDWIA